MGGLTKIMQDVRSIGSTSNRECLAKGIRYTGSRKHAGGASNHSQFHPCAMLCDMLIAVGLPILVGGYQCTLNGF